MRQKHSLLAPLNQFAAAKMTDAEYVERLKSNTIATASGCWEWQGFHGDTSKNRYGETGYRGKRYRVHRLMYLLTKGAIPEGQVVRHKCDNSICLNPDHLELGTQFENCQDAATKGRYWHHESRFKFCKHGHEFTPENTYVTNRGFRQCKTCDKLRIATPEYKAWRLEYQRRRRAKLKSLQMSET